CGELIEAAQLGRGELLLGALERRPSRLGLVGPLEQVKVWADDRALGLGAQAVANGMRGRGVVQRGAHGPGRLLQVSLGPIQRPAEVPYRLHQLAERPARLEVLGVPGDYVEL
ncbi:MAG: hypothetical protein AAFP22_22265, partial [Planctomycetota bacterium]